MGDGPRAPSYLGGCRGGGVQHCLDADPLGDGLQRRKGGQLEQKQTSGRSSQVKGVSEQPVDSREDWKVETASLRWCGDGIRRVNGV